MKHAVVGFISLGCPKNRCDTEVMLKRLVDAGYDVTADETEADAVVVNTCAFIESAKRESIDEIIELGWLKKHRSLKAIIVAGCLAERYREEIFKELPEADAVIGVGGVNDIAEAVAAALERADRLAAAKKAGKPAKTIAAELPGYACFPDKETSELGGERVLTMPEHSAYLKIAEGCSNRCTYCSIPLIRGKMRSRDIPSVVSEAKELEALGVKELILVAQDTTAYGEDIYGRQALPELVGAILEATDIPWLRLLYCYPERITDEITAMFRDNDRVCKYIDLPVQHISENVLRRMNRHGGAAAVRDALAKLRDIPGMVIRSTVITGFPGETEEDFAELCDFLSEGGRPAFDRLGAFAYSREEDTPAYDFPGQVDEEVRQSRADAVMELQSKLLAARPFRPYTARALVEGYDVVAETYFGRTYADAPEIDGKVFFSSEKKLNEGDFVDVKIEEADAYDLYGCLANRE